jgi:exo-beta-1,3-glucanase (GH17 family)
MQTVATLLTLLSAASAAYTGYNLDAEKADGSCKAPADWAADFAAIKSWPNPTKGPLAVRVFASSDCNTIANIAQPAKDAGIKVFAGVWAAESDGHFAREKNALDAALKQYGCEWLAGVSVGSEDLYRKEIPAARLAEQINDVRGLVRKYASVCPFLGVTHTDTWTAWVDPANAPVIKAADFIVVNAFPYWQGAEISTAGSVLATALANVRAVVGGKVMWLGETGQPTAGANEGLAVPSVANLQSYYRQTVCNKNGPLNDLSFFWFSAFDHKTREAGVEQNFGLATTDRQLKISLSC